MWHLSSVGGPVGAGNKSGQLLMPATDTPGTNEYGQANVNKCVLFVVLCESGPMHLAEPTFARVPTAERKTCFRGELQSKCRSLAYQMALLGVAIDNRWTQ